MLAIYLVNVLFVVGPAIYSCFKLMYAGQYDFTSIGLEERRGYDI